MEPTAADTMVVLITVPEGTEGGRIGRTLVEEHLAACVNIVSGVRSVFRWEGKVSEEAEALLIVKTTRDRYSALESRVKAIHPYSLPEIIALPITAGLPGYLEWVATETRPAARA
ncbi:MAG: divalent-cation tolerance protein CutA [Candidatus Methylomirabilales bacterium]